MLTTSCTDALEMAAILCNIQPGDEVIIPSYTFVSTALAFVRQGAKIVFADSMPNHPNIDADKIEALITPKTKVIVPVHYAGVACDMDKIMQLAGKYNLIVVEDAAQAVDSYHLTPNPSPEGEGGKIPNPLKGELERLSTNALPLDNPTKTPPSGGWGAADGSCTPSGGQLSDPSVIFLLSPFTKLKTLFPVKAACWLLLSLCKPIKEKELEQLSVSKESLLTAADGKNYKTNIYNLDVIISVGYRVKSQRGTQFRIWANKVLKNYLLKGYAVRAQFEQIENKISRHDKLLFEHEQKFDLLIKTYLPPHEGIFYDGQIFDAYIFVSDIIKSATSSITLIDNYIDESVLSLLLKRTENVTATIYTAKISKQLSLDMDRPHKGESGRDDKNLPLLAVITHY